MDEPDDFILEEDDDADLPPEEPLPESKSETQNIALSERFSRLSKGLSGQVDAVKERLKPRMIDVEEVAALEAADMSIEMDGLHTFEWPLKGMDCPDCAAKAKRATQRMPGVQKVNISATMGTAEISLDIGQGHTSKLSSLLSSLGHEPDLPWQRIIGVTATGLAEKNSVGRTELRQLLAQIPGILDVRFEDACVELQIVPNLEQKLTIELDTALHRIIGPSFTL